MQGIAPLLLFTLPELSENLVGVESIPESGRPKKRARHALIPEISPSPPPTTGAKSPTAPVPDSESEAPGVPRSEQAAADDLKPAVSESCHSPASSIPDFQFDHVSCQLDEDIKSLKIRLEFMTEENATEVVSVLLQSSDSCAEYEQWPYKKSEFFSKVGTAIQDLSSHSQTGDRQKEPEDGPTFTYLNGVLLPALSALMTRHAYYHDSLKPGSQEAQEWMDNYNTYFKLGQHGWGPLIDKLEDICDLIKNQVHSQQAVLLFDHLQSCVTRLARCVEHYRETVERWLWDWAPLCRLQTSWRSALKADQLHVSLDANC